MSKWRWYRQFIGGTWHYVRPYDNLYCFTWMRYWTKDALLYNEIVLKTEVH